MIKFVLVYPQFLVREGPKFNVPMGPLHLGTYLESKGIEVKFIDCNIEDNYLALLRKELPNALCLGISAMTAQLPNALEICRAVKKEFSNLPIILGGVHATLFPEQTVRDPLIDYAVIGEGEVPLLSLIYALQKRETPEGVGGIAFLDKNGKFKINPKQEKFDFQKMPLINYGLLSKKVIEQFKTNYVGALTSRGCPYRCTFCINSVVPENRVWRSWGAKRVIDEIESLARFGCKKVWFWDDSFFVSKRRIEQIMEEMDRRGVEFEWFAAVRADYFRPDCINPKFLKRLHQHGWRRSSIGAESGSQKVLDYLNKDIKVENLYTAASAFSKTIMESNFSFMIGVPKESKEDIRKTVEAIREISNLYPKAKFLGPQLFRPYPGAKLYFECLKAGLKEPKSLSEWAKIISTEFMESDPFKMPWIKNPEFVNTVWFYSILLAISYKRLIQLWLEYCRVYKLKKIMYFVGIIGIILVSSLGRVRYRLNFHKFPLEIKTLKKYRAVLSY